MKVLLLCVLPKLHYFIKELELLRSSWLVTWGDELPRVAHIRTHINSYVLCESPISCKGLLFDVIPQIPNLLELADADSLPFWLP